MNIDGRCSSRDFTSVPVRGGVFYLRNQWSSVEPLVSLSSALNGVRVLLEAYEGYERARFLETDAKRSVRELQGLASRSPRPGFKRHASVQW